MMVNEAKRTLLYSLNNSAKKDIETAMAWARIYQRRSTGRSTSPYMIASLVYIYQTSNGLSNAIGKALCETIEYDPFEATNVISCFRFPVSVIYNVMLTWMVTDDVPDTFNVQLLIKEYDLMHAAAARDDVDVAIYISRYNIDVDIKDPVGKTALHIAAACGGMRITRYLISTGASLFSLDHAEITPLEAALNNNQFEVAEILNPELVCNLKLPESGETLLMRLIRRGFEPQVRYMLPYADFTALNYKDQNIFHICCDTGQEQILEAILHILDSQKVCLELVNATDAFNRTPLFLAARNNRVAMVRQLLAAGAVYTPDFVTFSFNEEIKDLLKQYSTTPIGLNASQI